MNENDGQRDDALNDELEDEIDFELDDELDLEDRVGSIEQSHNGNEIVLSWSRRGANEGTEMLRFDQDANLRRIFPKVRRGVTYDNPFDQLTELQVEAPDWNPKHHSAESDRYGLLHVVGLPKGFSAVYDFGLGVMRNYRGLLEEIEKRTSCTAVRFVASGDEGPTGSIFRLTLERFESYRAAVDRNRGRASTAVRRVVDAESHNAVAALLNLDPVEPKYGTNPVIRAITEEVATGYVTSPADRATLVDHVVCQASQVAHETPERFGRLREDIELVSLKVLIEQFEQGLRRRAGRKPTGRTSFLTNPFALQQVFSAPILVVRGQVHVRGTDALGQGRASPTSCASTPSREAQSSSRSRPRRPR